MSFSQSPGTPGPWTLELDGVLLEDYYQWKSQVLNSGFPALWLGGFLACLDEADEAVLSTAASAWLVVGVSEGRSASKVLCKMCSLAHTLSSVVDET